MSAAVSAGRGFQPRRLLAGAALLALVIVTGTKFITPSSPAAPSSPRGNVALGQQMAAQPPYRWTGSQWGCLYATWMQESGWSATAANSGSDARGIAQDINGWSAANPYDDAAGQIAWGLAYIQGRYGTPCGAWSHEVAKGWY